MHLHPGARLVRPDDGDGGMWFHRKACVEAKPNHEGVSIRSFNKKLDDFFPERYLGCVLYVRLFWSFDQMSIYVKELCGQPTSLASLLSFVVRARLGERGERIFNLIFLPSMF